MSWNHFRIFFTPKNALLSGANSPNLNSLERFRRTMPPTVIPCHAPGPEPRTVAEPSSPRASSLWADFYWVELSTRPSSPDTVALDLAWSDLRYMFRQTKEWRQAAEPAYGYRCFGSKRKSEASTKICPYLAH